MLFLCVVGSIEFNFNTFTFSLITVYSILLVISGVALRIWAIKSLGSMWSFNIKIYKNREVIRSGAYKYFNHPGYLGNIYILGIFSSFNLFWSAGCCLIFITSFGLWRSYYEHKLLIKDKLLQHPCPEDMELHEIPIREPSWQCSDKSILE